MKRFGWTVLLLIHLSATAASWAPCLVLAEQPVQGIAVSAAETFGMGQW